MYHPPDKHVAAATCYLETRAPKREREREKKIDSENGDVSLGTGIWRGLLTRSVQQHKRLRPFRVSRFSFLEKSGAGEREKQKRKGETKQAKQAARALTEEKHISLLLLPPSLFFLPTDLDSLDRPSPPPLPHPSLTLPFSSTSPVGPHRRIPYQTRFSLEGSGSGTGPPLWQTIAEGPSSDPIPLFVTPHTFLLSYPSWSPSGRASPLDRATPFRSLNTPASSPR